MSERLRRDQARAWSDGADERERAAARAAAARVAADAASRAGGPRDRTAAELEAERELLEAERELRKAVATGRDPETMAARRERRASAGDAK